MCEMPTVELPGTEKVVAYVVRDDRLVVFIHEDDTDPVRQSGLQVPAGTCESQETPSQAVLREAHEETGLDACASSGISVMPTTTCGPTRTRCITGTSSTSPSMVPSPMSGASSDNTAEPNTRRRSGSSGYRFGRLMSSPVVKVPCSAGWPTISLMSSG